MALGRLILSPFWPLCADLCDNRPPNAQTAISQLLFVRLNPIFFTIPHLDEPCKYIYALQMAWGQIVLSPFWPFCTVLCVNHPPNAQTAVSQLLFVLLSPISSPFLIWMQIASIFMHCNWIWAGSFYVHFGPFVLFCVSIVPHPPMAQTAISQLLFVRLSPISSPFLIWMGLGSNIMRCKWFWYGTFCLHLVSSVLWCVSIVPHMPKLPYLSFYLPI